MNAARGKATTLKELKLMLMKKEKHQKLQL